MTIFILCLSVYRQAFRKIVLLAVFLTSAGGMSCHVLAGDTHESFAESRVKCPEYQKTVEELLDLKNIEDSHRFFQELEGKKIRSIEYRRINVFDPENEGENSSIYRFVNTLHFLTKESSIASQLLFQEGEEVKSSLIIESERVLRSREYLSNAFIVPAHVCGAEVDILVITQDSWTTNPKFSFGRSGGDSNYGFGFQEGNLFGTGNSFSIGYESDPDRSSVNYSFKSPRFLEKEISFDVIYSDTSDGKEVELDLAHPFYSLESPWAFGTENDISHKIETIEEDKTILNEYLYEKDIHEVFYGRAITINEQQTRRLYSGLTTEKHEYFENEFLGSAPPISRKRNYVWFEYEHISNDFAVYRNIDQIYRVEDIPMGANLNVRLGYGGTSLGNDSDVGIFRFNYSNAYSYATDHLFRFSSGLDSRYYGGEDSFSSSLVSFELDYHYQINKMHRWFIGAKYNRGSNLLPHEELTLGGEEGMRGYISDYWRGDERFLVSLERRFFYDVHLFKLIRLASVVFVESGKIRKSWDDESSPVLNNIGFGIRMTSSRTHLGRVVHADIAFPMEKDQFTEDYQISLGAEAKF